MIPPDPWPQPTDLQTQVANPLFNGLEKHFINKVMDSGRIGANGAFTKQVEEDFSKYFGAKALLVSNGSVALTLALTALNIGPNDEVIVPNLTYAATASAVINTGAIPVLCDVELETWNISPTDLEERITKRTKAIIVVHLYGLPADMDQLKRIASKYRLSIIEDSAEAFGAEYKGNLVGTLGDIGTFSFFPNKIITSGEGGLVISLNTEVYKLMKLLRGQGMSEDNRYYFLKPGFNFRMTELHASILKAQLLEFENLWEARTTSETVYRDNLSEVVIESNAHYQHRRSPWIFSARIPQINIESKLRMAISLASKGIETRPVFYPLSQMPAFSRYANSNYPNSNIIAKEGISLPTGSHVQVEVQKMIIDIVKEYAVHAKS